MKDVANFCYGARRIALRRLRGAVLRDVVTSCLSLAFVLAGSTVAGAQFTVETKLTASDAAEGGRFGSSVGISGNTAIIGAHSDDALILGAPALGSGSAYLIDVTTGHELFKLTASDGAASDSFGWSVAIEGSVAIVGAPFDDDAGSGSGSAYLYDVTSGSELFKPVASDAAGRDAFGWSVAISGNTAIVGALRNDAAYLFDVTTGNELFKLTAGDAVGGESFGASVAISGNVAIVGAEADSDAGSVSGSAYLYNVTTGIERFKLTASGAAAFDEFGSSVAIYGDTAIVGAKGAGENSGAAYAFDVTTGSQTLEPIATDTVASNRFGLSVAISDGTALIGAPGNDDGAGFESGSAYLFTSASLAGDLTGNGFVDFADLTVLLANWDQDVGSELGNLVDSANTPVNFADLTALLAAWTGSGTTGAPGAALGAESVPEPSAMTLALVGLLGVCCWHRKPARRQRARS